MDKERVLFVGVEGSLSRGMIALLEGRQYDVSHAVDADQASEALQVQHFGLIVCGPSIPLDRLRHHPEMPESGWLVELHDSDAEPALQLRSNGASTEAVIAGLGNLERVTDLLDRLLIEPGEPAADPARRRGSVSLNLPVLDLDQFRGQMHNDAAVMSEIIHLYLKETNNQVRELGELVQRRDVPAACRLAHTLKGSFGAVFAYRAGALARELETAMAAGDLSFAGALLAPLKESAAAAETVLGQLLEVG